MRGVATFEGKLSARVRRAQRASIWWKARNFPYVWPGLWRHALARSLNMNHMLGTLRIRHILAGGNCPWLGNPLLVGGARIRRG